MIETTVTHITYLSHGVPEMLIIRGEVAGKVALSVARKLHDQGAAIGSIAQYRKVQGMKTKLITRWDATPNFSHYNTNTYFHCDF